VASERYNNLVIFSIILAGVLVGVQSYPEMESNAFLGLLDGTVQVIFTFDCIFKIFAEGVNPLRYWTGPESNWNNFDFWLVLVCWLPVGGNGKKLASTPVFFLPLPCLGRSYCAPWPRPLSTVFSWHSLWHAVSARSSPSFHESAMLLIRVVVQPLVADTVLLPLLRPSHQQWPSSGCCGSCGCSSLWAR